MSLIVLFSTGVGAFLDAAAASREAAALLRAEVEAKQRFYAALAANVSQGEVRAVDAGHESMLFRQPDTIVEAIRDLAR